MIRNNKCRLHNQSLKNNETVQFVFIPNSQSKCYLHKLKNCNSFTHRSIFLRIFTSSSHEYFSRLKFCSRKLKC